MRDLKNIFIIILIFLLPLVILSFLGVDLEANGDADTKPFTGVIKDWGQKPFLSTIFPQPIPTFVGNKVFCPVCQEKEMKSIVYVGLTLGTLLYCQPYYDEEGIYHYEDPNTYTTSYSCSKGHEWSISRSGDKEWESIQKNTEDEPIEYFEIEEGELSLHDDSEIVWNEFSIDYKAAQSVIFGDNVGKISWDEGVMEFEGDADESAKIFFEVILKSMIDNYIEYELNENALVELTVEEPEQILIEFTTTGEWKEYFRPQLFIRITDTDLSRCFVDGRLKLDLNGEIYWIQLIPDDEWIVAW